MSAPQSHEPIQAGMEFLTGSFEHRTLWAATYQSDIGNLVMAAAISFGPDIEHAPLTTQEALDRMDAALMQHVFGTPQSMETVTERTHEFAHTIVNWHREGTVRSIRGVSVVATNGDHAVASYAGEGTLAISRSRESSKSYAYTNPRRFDGRLRALDRPLSFDLEGKDATILVSSGIARAREVLSQDPRMAKIQAEGAPGAFVAIRRTTAAS